MRLLITRPQPDADELAADLTARGHTCVVAPVLEILPRDAEIGLSNVQALLVTSRNGVRALGAAIDQRDIPLLAVGPGTAEAAQAAGFSTLAASGDVAALGALVRETLRPDAGTLLWITGKNVRGDLRADLRAAGFQVFRHVLYEARPVTVMPNAGATALEGHEIDGALFFSPRTAQSFVRILTMAGLSEAMQTVTAFCLSPAVAAALAGIPWGGLEIAGQTDRNALLDLIDEVEAKARNAE